MKKWRIFIFFLIVSFLLVDNWNAINFTSTTTRTNSCSEANVNTSFYLSWNDLRQRVVDKVRSTNERVISNNNSSVSFWTSDTSLVSGCLNSSDWSRISDFSPWWNLLVYALWSRCTFNKPTDINNRNFQFVFNIGLYEITPWIGLAIGDYDLDYYTQSGSVTNDTPDWQKSFTNVGFNM